MGRGGTLTHTVSGIDITPWDILGQATGQPVGWLLGGVCRTRVRPYCSLLMEKPTRLGAAIAEQRQRGFTAYKIGWGPFGRAMEAKLDEAIVRAARESAGPAGGGIGHRVADHRPPGARLDAGARCADQPGRTGGGRGRDDRLAADDLVRRYAERRGLAPESQIILRPGRGDRAAGREAEKPTPRRNKFAGLKLKGELVRQPAERPMERAEPPAPRPADTRTWPEIERNERLTRGLTAYTKAWADAGRMTRAGLPVLAHQAEAMARSGQALDALALNLTRDTRAALERAPALARDAGTEKGVMALGVAIGAERRARLALDERGRAAVRTWGALERAYEAAEKDYDWQGKRRAGTRMEAFAKELKRDPQLDSLLRQRGRELGIGDGSRLDQVAQAREDDIARALRRDLGISLGHDMGLGR